MKKYTYWLMAALMVFSTFSVALANEPDEEAAFLQQVTTSQREYVWYLWDDNAATMHL